MVDIILGSQSPRRKEILNFFTLPFRQIASNYDESLIPFTGNPQAYATELAMKKAESLARHYPESLILTADTVVYFRGMIYNKPQSQQEAFDMLSHLAGHWHHVYTAVTVQQGERRFSQVEETKILFHPLTPEQIQTYHRHCSFLDKAGAYTIQGSGNILIKHIDGCYYNVMGLPIHALKELLLKMGIDLWNHLKSGL